MYDYYKVMDRPLVEIGSVVGKLLISQLIASNERRATSRVQDELIALAKAQIEAKKGKDGETPALVEPVTTSVDTSINDGAGTSQIEAKGSGCAPCGVDHFSTVAGSLSEALRFARTHGLAHPQVQDRIALCFDELNIFERIDAAPDKILNLPPDERAFVEKMLVESRTIRHRLSDVTTVDQLVGVAAYVHNLSRENRVALLRLRLRLAKSQDGPGTPEIEAKG